MRKLNVFKWFLLFFNILVVILLAVSQLAVFIPPSKQALFSVLALFYPVLFFVNAIMIVVWLIFKRKYWLISFLVIIIGFINLRDNFQFHPVKECIKTGDDFKMVTYNVRLFSTDKTGKDSPVLKKNILDFLESEQPDIICLQEYHSLDRNVYLPLKELTNKLEQNTYYYESYYSPRFDQLSGLVIFSKYKAVNKGKLKIEGSRTFGIYTDLLIGGDTIRVINIHLASIRLQDSDIDFVLNPDFNNKQELKQHSSSIYSKLNKAFLLREKQVNYIIRKIRKSPYPVILSGDFNDTPSSYVYHQLSKLLTDSFVEQGNRLGRTYAGQLPYLRIDYTFISDLFTVKCYNRVIQYYSDHFPVITLLEISK
jgi:endonuclease/exonuclease/phosphatase family metal-dependent hydrolase